MLTNKQVITVADILSDLKAYVGKTLYDPLEGVEYGHATAKILRGDTDGRPFIKSHAHGSVIYQLMSESKYRYVPGFQMVKGEGLSWIKIKTKSKKDKDEEDESDNIEKLRVCNAFETLGQTFILGEREENWGKLSATPTAITTVKPEHWPRSNGDDAKCFIWNVVWFATSPILVAGQWTYSSGT